MDLENTTLLSALVSFTGILAEFIFHETLTGSALGVVLSVVLAVIIICCAYFAMDGLQKSISAMHKREENRKREFDEKLFRLLNKKLCEQVKLQKGIYALLAKGVKSDAAFGKTENEEDSWKKLAESINSSTMKAAKLVVKYNQKNRDESDRILGQTSEEMLQAIRSMSNQIQMLNGEIQELVSRAAVTEEPKEEITDLQAAGEDNSMPQKEVLSAEEAFASQEMEDADVYRMMEELFNEDMTAKPENSVGNGTEEMVPEVVSEEIIPEPVLEIEQEEKQEERENNPKTESYEQDTEEAGETAAAMYETEEAVSEEQMTEDELDSLLSELLPAAEPVEDVLSEEGKEQEKDMSGLTALDMLLNKQQKKEGTVAEPEEPAVDIEVAKEEMFEPERVAADADETLKVKEPELEPEPEPVQAVDNSDPGKMMSPDDIAALIASMNS